MNGNHKNHKYYLTTGTGFCDCGLNKFLKEEGFCKHHFHTSYEDEPSQRGKTPNLKKKFIILIGSIISYVMKIPNITIKNEIYEDVLTSWNYLVYKMDKGIDSNPIVLLFFIDIFVNKELIKYLPEKLAMLFSDPMKQHLTKYTKGISQNLQIMLSSESQGELSFNKYLNI